MNSIIRCRALSKTIGLAQVSGSLVAVRRVQVVPSHSQLSDKPLLKFLVPPCRKTRWRMESYAIA